MKRYKANFSSQFWLICSLMTSWVLGSPAWFQGVAQANTLTVSTLNDAGVGSLREAVGLAAPGDTITFSVTGTIILTSSQITIAKNLTIKGPGPTGLTIKRSEAFDAPEFRLFDSTAGTLTLSGLTLSNGLIENANGGGAIHSAGTLVVDNCVFSGNRTLGNNDGAAIYAEGKLAVTNSTFSANISNDYAGAILCTDQSTLKLANCDFSDNQSNEGNAMYLYCSATIENCNFSDGPYATSGGAVQFVNGTVTVTGSTFTGNYGGNGGAICNLTTLNVRDCTFSKNKSASQGGAIYNQGVLVVDNSNFSGGTYESIKPDGGAIFNRGIATVTRSSFTNNTAHDGGGIFNQGTLTVDSSSFSENTGAAGAAIYNGPTGIITLTNSTISDNHGGGLFNYYRMTVRQCTFNENDSITGAIFSASSAGVQNVVSYCTITGNASDNPGGGIRNEAGNLNLQSSIVAGNSAPSGPDCSGTITSQDYNLIQDTSGCTITGSAAHNIYGQDPQLGPLQNNGGPTKTFALLANSPAIDAGNPDFDATATPFDQRGASFSRVRRGRIDIGAYEYQYETPIIKSLTLQPEQPRTNDTLTAAISSNAAFGENYSYTLVWKKTVGQATTVLDETSDKLDLSQPGNGDKGDIITLEVVAHGTLGDSIKASAQATVQNSAPVVTAVEISDSEPNTTAKIKVTPTATDADGDPLTFAYVWTKTVGEEATTLTETSDTLDLATEGNGNIGDLITVSVTAKDEEVSSEPVAKSVTVANSSPQLTLTGITPKSPKTNDKLKAQVEGSDPDGGILTFSYEWKKIVNGQTIPLAEMGDTLDLAVKGNGDKGNKITLTSRALDGNGGTSMPTTVQVTVGNSAPDFVAATYFGKENKVLSSKLKASDADGDALHYVIQTKSKHGTLELASSGAFTYTPKPNWNGEDSFQAYAIDSSDAKTKSVITLKILAVNSAPIAVNDTLTGKEDVPLQISAVQLLKNDVNGEAKGEADALRIVAVKTPSSFPGKLKLDVNAQKLLFTPQANWNGNTTFVYTVEDSGAKKAQAMVTLKILPVNDVPVVKNAMAKVLAGMPLDLALKGFDIEGDILTYSLTSGPAHGTGKIIQKNGTAVLHYVSDADFSGEETLQFVARDKTAISSAAQITIDVLPNHAPTLVSLSPNSGTLSPTQTVQFEQKVRDRDGSRQLDAVSLLLSNTANTATAAHGAIMWLDCETGRFSLSKDNGRDFLPGVPYGQTLENSQVRVTLAESGVLYSADGTLTVKWTITFKTGYEGTKSLWSRAEDLSGASVGYSKQGQVEIEAVPATIKSGPTPSAPAS